MSRYKNPNPNVHDLHDDEFDLAYSVNLESNVDFSHLPRQVRLCDGVSETLNSGHDGNAADGIPRTRWSQTKLDQEAQLPQGHVADLDKRGHGCNFSVGGGGIAKVCYVEQNHLAAAVRNLRNQVMEHTRTDRCGEGVDKTGHNADMAEARWEFQPDKVLDLHWYKHE